MIKRKLLEIGRVKKQLQDVLSQISDDSDDDQEVEAS
jgi:hypothetical protein